MIAPASNVMKIRELIARHDIHRVPPPVTLPKVEFCTLGDDAREAAERVAERRIIRAGIDAWHAIGKAESFENWKRIGAALSIGKVYALRVTGANCAWGQNYSRLLRLDEGTPFRPHAKIVAQPRY